MEKNNFNKLPENKNSFFTNIMLSSAENDVKSNKVVYAKKYMPAQIKSFVNSVYSFNKNFVKTLPQADVYVNKLLKGYFSLNLLSNNELGKKSRLLIRRYKRLSLNRILVSKPEIKHMGNFVNINIYLFNKKKTTLLYHMKNIYNLLSYKDVLGLKLLNPSLAERLVEFKNKKANTIYKLSNVQDNTNRVLKNNKIINTHNINNNKFTFRTFKGQNKNSLLHIKQKALKNTMITDKDNIQTFNLDNKLENLRAISFLKNIIGHKTTKINILKRKTSFFRNEINRFIQNDNTLLQESNNDKYNGLLKYISDYNNMKVKILINLNKVTSKSQKLGLITQLDKLSLSGTAKKIENHNIELNPLQIEKSIGFRSYYNLLTRYKLFMVNKLNSNSVLSESLKQVQVNKSYIFPVDLENSQRKAYNTVRLPLNLTTKKFNRTMLKLSSLVWTFHIYNQKLNNGLLSNHSFNLNTSKAEIYSSELLLNTYLLLKDKNSLRIYQQYHSDTASGSENFTKQSLKSLLNTNDIFKYVITLKKIYKNNRSKNYRTVYLNNTFNKLSPNLAGVNKTNINNILLESLSRIEKFKAYNTIYETLDTDKNSLNKSLFTHIDQHKTRKYKYHIISHIRKELLWYKITSNFANLSYNNVRSNLKLKHMFKNLMKKNLTSISSYNRLYSQKILNNTLLNTRGRERYLKNKHNINKHLSSVGLKSNTRKNKNLGLKLKNAFAKEKFGLLYPKFKNIYVINKLNKIDKFFDKYNKLLISNTQISSNVSTMKTQNIYLLNIRNLLKRKLLELYFDKESLFIYYMKNLYENKVLFKNFMIQKVVNIISTIYNKKVKLNIISLKYLYLNSDILGQAINIKLRNHRKNRYLKVLSNVLNMISVARLNHYSYNHHTTNYKYIENHYQTMKNLPFKIFNDIHNISKKLQTQTSVITQQSNTKSIFESKIFNNFYLESKPIRKLHQITSDQINFIKHKSIFGVRLETKGRLTKRSTASRSIFKFAYIGNLKYNNVINRDMPSVYSKNKISNLQFTKISSKTRNGSFGIKGWINSN